MKTRRFSAICRVRNSVQAVNKPAKQVHFDKLKKGMSAEEVDAILGIGGGGMLADGVNLFNLTYERIGPSRPWEWEEIAVETSFDGKRLTKASLRVKKKTVTEWLRGWCAWIGL